MQKSLSLFSLKTLFDCKLNNKFLLQKEIYHDPPVSIPAFGVTKAL